MPKTTTISRRDLLRPLAARPTPPAISGLTPYAGPWTRQEASHLLSRTTNGATFLMLQEATQQGLELTLDQLLAPRSAPPPPVSHEDDGVTPAGESWVDRHYPAGAAEYQAALGIRRRSLWSWINKLRLEEGTGIDETMVLFWHNHFAINNVGEPRWNYRYLNLLRTHALGNFRDLVKDITVDALMLGFLDGTRNTVRAPNENYARELLELFTLGKGPQVGPGDYTTYTEDDVMAMARSLTGWRNRGYGARRPEQETTPYFDPRRHDTATVQLSARFGNQELASAGADTYRQLVDLILAKDEVARFIVRKLYRWFVFYEIDPATEAAVIEPLATQFRDGGYVLRPVLRTLLGSEHFFDVLRQGPMIKHPIRSVVGTLRQLQVRPNNPERPVEHFYLAMYQRCNNIGMADFRMDNVAGWKAFYQEPLYYRQWINSATLPLRKRITDQLFANFSRLQGYGAVTFSLLELVKQFPEPGQLWPMIDEWITLLFPRPLPDSQREYIKNILLPGLPDTQWAVEYADHRANPDDANLAQALETNLRRMVKAMLEMPEFQLS